MDDPNDAREPGGRKFSEQLAHPWRRLVLALNEFFTHVVGASVILGILQYIQYGVLKTSPVQELIFFKGLGPAEFKGAWLFDAADVGIIGVFSWRGIIAFWKALKE